MYIVYFHFEIYIVHIKYIGIFIYCISIPEQQKKPFKLIIIQAFTCDTKYTIYSEM